MSAEPPTSKRARTAEEDGSSASGGASAGAGGQASRGDGHKCSCGAVCGGASSGPTKFVASPTLSHPLHLDIRSDVEALKSEIVANRRYLHTHPELSFEEHETAKYVEAQLRSYGIEEIHTGIGRTGVVGVIHGGAGEGPCIALRADMDGLPIEESTGLEFCSKNSGKMHACGHDGHMAILLGVSRLLLGMKDTLRGRVLLMFQPAEEGEGGAPEMIKDGVLDKYGHVDEVYGLHLWNYQAFGSVGVQAGPVMANTDRFTIVVSGSGGHGAAPQGTVDSVVIAAQVIIAIQTIISRNLDPTDSGVLTCGVISGGFAPNVIAPSVTIEGTSRSYSKKSQDTIVRRLKEICDGFASMTGADISVDYRYGYPATVNTSKECVEVVEKASRLVVGDNAGPPYLTMAGEDFSFFLLERPGCFFFVGSAPEGDELIPHHKPNFTVHEDSLLVGASVFLNVIEDRLGKGPSA